MEPRGRRRKERGGQAVSNPRPIQSLHLLPGENTRGICREVALPTLGGVDFFKRWHLWVLWGFPAGGFPHPPPLSVVDEVAADLTAERAAGTANTAQA